MGAGRAARTTADVILLNTCAIREHAEARVLGRLGDLARHKARRPGVRIGVTGCMAQHLRHDAARARAAGRSPGRARTATATCRRCSRRERARSARRAAPRQRRDLRRPPGGARARRARLGHHHARLRPVLHVLHRALRARPRAQPARVPSLLEQVRAAADGGAPRSSSSARP